MAKCLGGDALLKIGLVYKASLNLKIILWRSFKNSAHKNKWFCRILTRFCWDFAKCYCCQFIRRSCRILRQSFQGHSRADLLQKQFLKIGIFIWTFCFSGEKYPGISQKCLDTTGKTVILNTEYEYQINF